MVHLPIPATPEAIEAAWPHVAPFLPAIAKSARVPVEALAAELLGGETQAHLAWDSEGRRAKALLGTRLLRRGEDLVCELSWLTGKDRHEWTHLLPSVTRWARDMGCSRVAPVVRPGWRKTLEQHGFRVTHVVMDKEI